MRFFSFITLILALPILANAQNPNRAHWQLKSQNVIAGDYIIQAAAILTQSSQGQTSIALSTDGSTAQNGTDFNLLTSAAVFQSGATISDPISIRIHASPGYNEARTIVLSMVGVSGSSVDITGAGQFTINAVNDASQAPGSVNGVEVSGGPTSNYQNVPQGIPVVTPDVPPNQPPSAQPPSSDYQQQLSQQGYQGQGEASSRQGSVAGPAGSWGGSAGDNGAAKEESTGAQYLAPQVQDVSGGQAGGSAGGTVYDYSGKSVSFPQILDDEDVDQQQENYYRPEFDDHRADRFPEIDQGGWDSGVSNAPELHKKISKRPKKSNSKALKSAPSKSKKAAAKKKSVKK
jgi:hypothetical protein